MTILRGELQTDNGDRLYPHTSSQCVFAPDGKTVDQQITDLSNRSVRAKGDFSGDANTFVLNGIARDIGGATNLPSVFGNLITFNSGTGGGNYLTQIYASKGYLGYRFGSDDKISGLWTQIATTEKIDISIPLINGFIPKTSPNWKTGIVKNGDGSYDLWFSVKKSDGSDIPINVIQIGTEVIGHKPDKFYIGSCTAISNDLDTQDVFCYIDGGRLMVHNTKSNAKELIGHIRYRTY